MNAKLLQNFRAMQLTLKGACLIYHKQEVEAFHFEGIDTIPMADGVEITEVSLDKDVVVIKFTYSESEAYLPIKSISEAIIEDLVDTMRAKALEIADRDVMVNGKGELYEGSWR